MKFRLSCAAIALSAVITGPASAADLGGNCCADLEERIAELEVTTARKGNRKVSLEVSGQVNEALLFWDDGLESNVYVGTNDTARSRFRFKGSAKIKDDWKAGYLLEIGVRANRLSRTNETTDEGESELDIRHNAWYIESKTYGKFSMGLTSTAHDGVTEVNTANMNHFARLSASKWNMSNSLVIDGVRANGADTTRRWRDLLPADGVSGDNVPGEGDRKNLIKYETPSFNGFTAAASWGEDDYWDVALRYSGEHGGFKLAAAAGYAQYTDDGNPTVNADGDTVDQSERGCASADPSAAEIGGSDPGIPGAGSDNDCETFGVSASIMHVDTGLFVTGAYGIKSDNLRDELFAIRAPGAGGGFDDEDHFWGIQAGIEKKWIDLGKTTIYGEYAKFEAGAQIGDTSGATRSFADPAFPDVGAGSNFSRGSEVTFWGIGINQHLESAAMDLYLGYRHHEGELTLGTTGSTATQTIEVEDLDLVMTGAMIKF